MTFFNVDTVVDLGKRIIKLRNQQGMSQAELATRAKISQNTIYKIESGKTKNPGNIIEIAAALGCTAEELRSGNDTTPEPPTSPLKAKLIRKISEADEDALTDIEEVVDAILKIASLKKKANS